MPLKAAVTRNAVWIGSLPLGENGNLRIVWADTEAVHVEDGPNCPYRSRDPILCP
jgi:hypothetical protein